MQLLSRHLAASRRFKRYRGSAATASSVSSEPIAAAAPDPALQAAHKCNPELRSVHNPLVARPSATPLSPHRRMAICLHLATVARPTGRYAPSRRPRRAPLAAAAAAAGPADFSPEQLQAGLQQQLRGNDEQAGVVEASAFTSQVPPKKASRREERAAAAAAAVRTAVLAGPGAWSVPTPVPLACLMEETKLRAWLSAAAVLLLSKRCRPCPWSAGRG